MKHREIKQLLPEVFKRTDQPGSSLHGLLAAMEALTEPAEEILQHLPLYFNPYNTPEKFLPFLAGWVDLDRFFSNPNNQSIIDASNFLQEFDSGRLRELIVAAIQLSKLRGTAKGLQSFLEIATGFKGFEIEETISHEKTGALPFHIKISAPKAAQIHSLLIERIIEQEKPAYVTYNLVFNLQEPLIMEKTHGQNS